MEHVSPLSCSLDLNEILTVVTAVPWSTDTISNLPVGLSGPHGDDVTNHLMTRNDGTFQGTSASVGKTSREVEDSLRIPEMACLHRFVRVTDSCGEHLDEHLALLGLLQRHILECQRAILFLDDDGLVGLGQGAGHV